MRRKSAHVRTCTRVAVNTTAFGLERLQSSMSISGANKTTTIASPGRGNQPRFVAVHHLHGSHLTRGSVHLNGYGIRPRLKPAQKKLTPVASHEREIVMRSLRTVNRDGRPGNGLPLRRRNTPANRSSHSHLVSSLKAGPPWPRRTRSSDYMYEFFHDLMLSNTGFVIRVAELPEEDPLVWIPTAYRFPLIRRQTGDPLCPP